MRQMLTGSLLTGLVMFVVSTGLPAGQRDGSRELRNVAIADGVELHYVEQGTGVPVVFVHGLMADYTAWDAQLGPFAENCRAIAYSRRYNYPNTNKLRQNHSAIVDAEDLAAFIKKLDLGKIHLVGHSYGAYTALFVGVLHPELVRTLVVAEAPVITWLADLPGDRAGPGRSELADVMERLVKPAKAAFEKGDAQGALRAAADYFIATGAYDKLPEPLRGLWLRNARELQALVTSDDMFPALERSGVQKIQVPVLMLSGENSPRFIKLIDDDLERILPEARRQRVTIRGASHAMWSQQPEACRRAVLEFIRGQSSQSETPQPIRL